MVSFALLRSREVRFLAVFGGLLLALASAAGAPADERLELFESQVRPLLAKHCYECHSGDRAEGGLRLDYRGGWEKGGDSGPSVVAGEPDESLLVQLARHEEAGREMPQGKEKLSASEIASLENWVRAGAFDPRETAPTGEEANAEAWEAVFDERKAWWSLQPVADPPLPASAGNAQTRQAIDRFVLAKLEVAGISSLAEPASRETILRRLSFALLGLPPDPAVREAFLADDSPAAYERLVDALLASPHFGERWARHWMDVVRYTDTYGYEWDMPAKGAWRYRDYLIRGFNQDVSIQQLLREQIAGDLLPNPRIDERERINESLIGPMFYQMGEKRHGDSSEFDGIHQEMLHNKIDAFSKAFQATTIGCARCHDHKLDAVSQAEYYALAGAFMSPRWVTRTLDLPDRQQPVAEQLQTLKSQLRSPIAATWREAAGGFSQHLFAAGSLAAPAPPAPDVEPAPALNETLLAAWTKAISENPDKPPPLEGLLSPWRLVQKRVAENVPVAQAWSEIAAMYAGERAGRIKSNAEKFRTIADFTKEIPAGWSVDGVGLRQGPSPSGEFTVAMAGEALVGRVLPAGLYTHLLSPRMNGAVRTPYLSSFTEPYFSIETAGGDFSSHRVVIDNAFLTEKQVYLTSPDPAWIAFSTYPQMKGRRNYVELATKSSNPNFPPRVGLGGPCSEAQVAESKSWLGITRVVAQSQLVLPFDELGRFETLFAGEAPQSLEEASEQIASWLSRAIDRWAEGQCHDEDVKLINGLLDRGLLPKAAGEFPSEAQAMLAEYRRVEAKLPEPQTVNGMHDLDPGFDYPLNVRGVYDDLGPAPPRGYLSCLPDSPEAFTDSGSGRLELAEAVASAHNPLTGRVFVNRVWHYLFGAGLVRTMDDFGHLGERPSHPELLDYLTNRFQESDWSLKTLVKSIVLSETFRQSGAPLSGAREIDPENRLLHHFPLRRLEAEAIRDSLLAVSGRLAPRLYGPPVDPPRPQEDDQKRLFSGPVDGEGRRSIYTKITIMEPPKFLTAFNQPTPKIPTGKRDVTNVPAQALAMLNDPLVIGQAQEWGAQLASQPHASPQERVGYMFERAFGRRPTARESERWSATARDFAELRSASDRLMSEPAVWQDMAHAMFNLKEFIFLP